MKADDLRNGRWPSEYSDYGRRRFHSIHVAHIATRWQGAVAKIGTDECRDWRYGEPMLSDWVKDALKHSGMSQAELGRRLSKHLRRSFDRAAVNKMTLGKREVAGDELIAIEEITGFPAPLENTDGIVKVPLLDSLVSAGNLSPREAVRPEDVERYIAASNLPAGNWFSLVVDGDSMDLVSPNGSIIFVNRDDTHLIDGGFYIVAMESDEGTTYKRYRENPEYLSPYSNNREHAPIFLDTAYRVVGRVYRTMLDIGPAALRRLK